jgi:7-cyano-7-deazaguanine synthase
MAIKRPKALVVLSGGQDSSTCLLWAKAAYDEVHAITFDYGQRHLAEIEAASRVAEIVGVASHRIVNLTGTLLGRSPLVDPSAELETYTDYASMDKTIGDRVEKTFVPLRNLLFLVVAVNHALAKDCFDVITGVCASDNANYPDCTAPFISTTEWAIREALGMYSSAAPQRVVRIVTPLLELDKAGIVRLATTFPGWQEVIAASHTCYAGETPPCGKCHACVLRAEGFRQAAVVDPLIGGEA